MATTDDEVCKHFICSCKHFHMLQLKQSLINKAVDQLAPAIKQFAEIMCQFFKHSTPNI